MLRSASSIKARVRTSTGPIVRAKVDTGAYPIGIKVPDSEMNSHLITEASRRRHHALDHRAESTAKVHAAQLTRELLQLLDVHGLWHRRDEAPGREILREVLVVQIAGAVTVQEQHERVILGRIQTGR
jgi:hypothetical protein